MKVINPIADLPQDGPKEALYVSSGLDLVRLTPPEAWSDVCWLYVNNVRTCFHRCTAEKVRWLVDRYLDMMNRLATADKGGDKITDPSLRDKIERLRERVEQDRPALRFLKTWFLEKYKQHAINDYSGSAVQDHSPPNDPWQEVETDEAEKAMPAGLDALIAWTDNLTEDCYPTAGWQPKPWLIVPDVCRWIDLHYDMVMDMASGKARSIRPGAEQRLLWLKETVAHAA